jgi:hypothetical protein
LKRSLEQRIRNVPRNDAQFVTRKDNTKMFAIIALTAPPSLDCILVAASCCTTPKSDTGSNLVASNDQDMDKCVTINTIYWEKTTLIIIFSSFPANFGGHIGFCDVI